MTDDVDGEPRTPAQRRADALVAVCAAALDHGERPPTTRRRRPHVSVVVTLEELEGGADAHTLDGRPVDAASLAAVLCDSRIHRFITDGASVVVDAGRGVRTVNHHLFGVPWRYGTGAAGSRVVTGRCRSAKRITSPRGSTADPPTATTWCCCVGVTITTSPTTRSGG